MSTPAPEPKKGISGLAIAGIGCGGLLILVLALGYILVGKACTKLHEITGEIQKNPARATAMLALKMNPDIEVLNTDDSKNEVTFRDKKSGKVTTLSFDDIAKGKFTIKDNEGNVVTVNGDGGGVLHSKGKDGEMTIGGASTAPDWVPAYPGATAAEGGMKMEKPDEVAGMAVSDTADPVAKVREFYESKLKDAGYKVETASFNSDGKDTVTISGTKDDGKSTISAVIAPQDGKTRVMVNYKQSKQQ